MKELNDIIEQKPVFLHQWTDKIDLISDFEDIYLSSEEYHAKESPFPNVSLWDERKDAMNKAIKEWESRRILFASYGYENYQGDAFVLFEQDGKLYEVNGSHCSCYGLEGQWDAEETTVEAIAHRVEKGTLGQDEYSGNVFVNELKEFLGI